MQPGLSAKIAGGQMKIKRQESVSGFLPLLFPDGLIDRENARGFGGK